MRSDSDVLRHADVDARYNNVLVLHSIYINVFLPQVRRRALGGVDQVSSFVLGLNLSQEAGEAGKRHLPIYHRGGQVVVVTWALPWPGVDERRTDAGTDIRRNIYLDPVIIIIIIEVTANNGIFIQVKTVS